MGLLSFLSPSAESEERKADALRRAGRFIEAARLYERAVDKAQVRHGADSLYAHALRDKMNDARRDAALAAAERSREAARAGDRAGADALLEEALRLAPTAVVRRAVEEAALARGGRRVRGRRSPVMAPRHEADEADEAAEAPVPAPVPPSAGPRIIDETHVRASLRDEPERVDTVFENALAPLAPEDAEHALTLGPDFREGYLALVDGRTDEALAALGRALRARPGDPLILELQADALVAANAPEAREALGELVDRHPDRQSAALALAEMLAAGGDLEGARETLERAIEARVEPAEDRRLELRLAEVAAGLGDTQAAYDIVSALAMETSGPSAEVLTVAAAVAHAAGDEASEAIYLRQAAEQSDAPSGTHEAFADYLTAHGGDPQDVLDHLGAARRRLSASVTFTMSEDERRRALARLLAKEVRGFARARRLDLAAERLQELAEDLGDALEARELEALRREIADEARDETEPQGLAPEPDPESPVAAAPVSSESDVTPMSLPTAEERDDGSPFMSSAVIAGGPDRELEPSPHAGELAEPADEGYVEFESEIRVEGPEGGEESSGFSPGTEP